MSNPTCGTLIATASGRGVERTGDVWRATPYNSRRAPEDAQARARASPDTEGMSVHEPKPRPGSDRAPRRSPTAPCTAPARLSRADAGNVPTQLRARRADKPVRVPEPNRATRDV